MEKFYEGTVTQLRPQLREHLSGLSYQEQDEVISLIKPLLTKTNPPLEEGESREPSLIKKDTYYKIHASDFNVLRECVNLVIGLSLWTIAGLPLASAPFGLAAALVFFLFQYRNKRFKLNGKQAFVLNTLKKAPQSGWSVHELAYELPIKPWLEEPEIESILNELKSIPKEDSTESALVRENNGKWRAIDVSAIA